VRIKKSLALLVALMTITATSCSSQTETENNNKSTINTTATESVIESDTGTDQSDSSETTEEVWTKKYFDFYSAKLYYPPSFEKDYIETFYWYGNLNTDDTIYYKADANVVYDSDTDYTYKDVPDIEWGDVFDTVNLEYKCYESKWTDNIENEQEVDIKGYTFIRREGTVHTEHDEETHEVSYVAYYGLMDFKTYGSGEFNAPTCWFAFSEVTDEATKDDLAAIVDKTATDFDWAESEYDFYERE
jgi:hypothetical protein